ncbi:LacI family DNA-binding transcriptional regulator [Shouchella shacheensis]|uniref:LacI family DNA-binding transcriptional regulator n=1 Tax=Shouchella shacheensis TaxID=1649580 RepID=UPI00073FD16B|nr:LacI family DNA-binding transcriptional regulator [Shouchella shacheensis]
MSKKTGRVTLLDVANHAGVSRATASLAVRNSKSISKKTKERVQASIEELGYVYDRVAAGLRLKKATTVGLIMTDIGNPFTAELLSGVYRSLDKEGYTVLLGSTFDEGEKQNKLLSTMMEYRVGGIILIPAAEGDETATLAQLKQFQVPVVTTVKKPTSMYFDYVGIDYEAGAQLAVNHLIEEGHRHIAFLGGSENATAWQDRISGYKKALMQAEVDVLPSLVIPSTATREGGAKSCEDLVALQDFSDCTAIFCFNDIVAFGVMAKLNQLGIKPGKDLAIIGFDNTPESGTFNPSLSSVTSHASEIGEQAGFLLHSRMQGIETAPKSVIYQPELIVRDSSTLQNKNP